MVQDTSGDERAIALRALNKVQSLRNNRGNKYFCYVTVTVLLL